MHRKIFKPGKGQTVERFTAAYVNGATVYPGDLVCWDVTAPTDQGSSGVLAGETLGTGDFIYVILPPAAAAVAQGLQAGIVRGPGVQQGSPNTAIGDDKLAIIQTWGVCATAWVDSTDTAAGDLLLTGATTGELTRCASADIATTVNAATGTLDGSMLCAFALAADAAVERAATSEQFAPVFVRCDF